MNFRKESSAPLSSSVSLLFEILCYLLASTYLADPASQALVYQALADFHLAPGRDQK